MKIYCLTVLVFINSMMSFSQTEMDADTSNLRLTSAVMENPITGANSENNNRAIYDITFVAKSTFSLKKITGEVNEKTLSGKIIYNNTISDSAIINNGSSFTLRFENYSRKLRLENKNTSRISNNTKCIRAKKISNDNALIFLSFYLENKHYTFKVRCSEKINSRDRQLPQ